MELIKETVNIGECICAGKTQVMSEGDVFVPDIKPDMLKILQVDAVSYITEVDLSDGKMNISGKIRVTVLYVPDSENERIRSINSALEFSQTVENDHIEKGMLSAAVSNVDRLEFSAVNSRKLRIKAVVGIDYEAACIREEEISGGAENENVEVVTKTLSMTEISDMCGKAFSVREKTEIPNGQSSVNEILKTDVKICDTEYKAVTGKLVAKGTVCICVLYTDDDCNIEFTETELPFTEVFDCDGIEEDSVCDIDYCIGEVTSSVSEDGDGDRRIIETEAEISANIKVSSSVKVEMLSDCYAPYKKTDIVRKTMTFTETTERPFAQLTLREIIDFPDDVPEVAGVYNVMARPVVSRAEVMDGKLVCEGSVEIYVLYLSDSAENPIYSLKRNIPFSNAVECGADGEARVKTDVKHIGYNLNAAGELELRCILAVNAEIIKRHEEEIIESAAVSEREVKRGMVIYFVHEGDTLWDTAKRYAVPQKDLIKFNNLEDDTLRGGMRLFIPAD